MLGIFHPAYFAERPVHFRGSCCSGFVAALGGIWWHSLQAVRGRKRLTMLESGPGPDYYWKHDGKEIFPGAGGDKAPSDNLQP